MSQIGFIFPQSFGVKIPKSMVIWVATIDRLNRLCALSGGGTCTYLEAKFHCHPELLKLLKFLGISTHTSGVSTSFRTMIGTVRPHETIKWVQPTWQAPGRGANPSKKKGVKLYFFSRVALMLDFPGFYGNEILPRTLHLTLGSVSGNQT